MKKQNLRICTLSGTNEIGRNSSFIEYDDSIIVVDCGFSFPEEQLFGFDYMIPNVNYLRKNKHKIKAILITHGHLDHTGGLQFILPDLDFPPIYAGKFANALIKEKLTEVEMDKKTQLIDVHRNTQLQIGPFRVSFIGVTHSIPNSFSIFIESQGGNIFFSGDYKIDLEPANEEQSDYPKLEALKGKVDLALMESTNATRPGKSKSAQEIAKNIEDIVREQKGRVIVASFSSLVSRLYSVIQIARKTNRKVVLSGRSLVTAVRIAREQHYLDIPDDTLIPEDKAKDYSDDRILFLTTGSQGEEFAALNRISKGEHKTIKIKDGDLILMSSSEIPDNIVQISHMTDRLIKAGAQLIKNDMMSIHETGHGMIEDMEMMYKMIEPRYVMPIHGWLTLRYQNSKNFIAWGMKPENVILTEDGQTWELENSQWKKGNQVESKPILIDGLGKSTLGDIILKDRQQLAEYGILNTIVNLSAKDGRLLGKPKFVSRGFVNTQTMQDYTKTLANIVIETHKDWLDTSRKNHAKKLDTEDLKMHLEKRLSNYIYRTIERRPIIMAVVL